MRAGDGKSTRVDQEAGGLLRHLVQNLNKNARLPSKDRYEVMKILKKKVRKRHGKDRLKRSVEVVNQCSSYENSSMTSVNNDWKHWVVLHGNEKAVVDDVWGIGKVVRVKFNGENHNMFSVLARAGKGNREFKNMEDKKGGAR